MAADPVHDYALDNEPVRAPLELDVPEGVTPPTRRGGARRPLPDVIVELAYTTPDQIEVAQRTARVSGRPIDQVLVDEGTITADQLARAIAERYGLDHLDLTRFKVDMMAANAIPPELAKRHMMVPVDFSGDGSVLVAMVDPANVVAVDDLAIRTGRRVRIAVASMDDITALIGRLNRLDAAVTEAVQEDEEELGPQEVTELAEGAVDTPVIKLVNSIIAQAVEQRASDIHLEPDNREMRVRLRVDGVLHESTRVPGRMVPGVISRIKIMGDLDISERRLPQDGRVSLTIEGRPIDVRIATMPSVHGETMVLRLLDKEGAVSLELPALGVREVDRERLERGLKRTHGAVLVTGPTGSGKSTTLYAAVQLINTPDKNVITIEDPVEYQLQGITQVQVNPKAGLDFATGLRATLRSDPDVILVGEIRDEETAQIAIEAAMTGHLVLSTLHTNDAASTITRLIEMGVEPFLVASAVDSIVAQRLCRVLCISCKRPTTIPGEVLHEHGFLAAADMEGYEPVGCARCAGTGYKSRVGLYEVLNVTEGIRSLALRRATPGEIAMFASAEGMTTLREDGLEKVRAGVTSIDEVIRVTGTV